MKLIQKTISDGNTTIHEHEIYQFAINRNKAGTLIYWYEDALGGMSYPDNLVLECRMTVNAVHLTVNLD